MYTCPVSVASNSLIPKGGTGEFAAMYDSVRSKFKDTHFAAVGLSMGANIVLRFFGERPARQKEFLCAVSASQGYDPAA